MFLLGTCGVVDSVNNTEDTITNINSTDNLKNGLNITTLNSSTVIGVNESASNIVAKTSDKIYTKYPTVTITSKPSCGCRYGYYWHTFSFVDYCPNCHRYNALVNKHKWPARFEQELTCKYCDCDWCGCCGKMKYSWSNTYLKKV